jgi:hypothetical protein
LSAAATGPWLPVRGRCYRLGGLHSRLHRGVSTAAGGVSWCRHLPLWSVVSGRRRNAAAPSVVAGNGRDSSVTGGAWTSAVAVASPYRPPREQSPLLPAPQPLPPGRRIGALLDSIGPIRLDDDSTHLPRSNRLDRVSGRPCRSTRWRSRRQPGVGRRVGGRGRRGCVRLLLDARRIVASRRLVDAGPAGDDHPRDRVVGSIRAESLMGPSPGVNRVVSVLPASPDFTRS